MQPMHKKEEYCLEIKDAQWLSVELLPVSIYYFKILFGCFQL